MTTLRAVVCIAVLAGCPGASADTNPGHLMQMCAKNPKMTRTCAAYIGLLLKLEGLRRLREREAEGTK